MDSSIYDLAIIGYGPAGITAAIYAARKKLHVILIGEFPGGEVRNSGEIENWPGDGQTDGIALSEKMTKHLQLHKDDVEIIEERVTEITVDNANIFTSRTATAQHQSKAVIYTTGRHPRKLGVPGEEEFKNRGVTYCATCDGPLFQDQNVVVVGGGNSGAEAVIMLQKIAKKIYLLHNSDKLPADTILVDNFINDPKVEIIYNAKTTKVFGETMVKGLEYANEAGETHQLEVSGIFVNVGAVPNTEPVKNLVRLDKYGAIEADRYGETSQPGFFAAGDVTNTRDAQIVVAAGQGCSAALSAGNYLSRLKE